MSDEWWVMSDENWVTEIEWWFFVVQTSPYSLMVTKKKIYYFLNINIYLASSYWFSFGSTIYITFLHGSIIIFSPPLTVGISSQLIKKQTQQKFILGILTNGFLKENYFTRNWFNLCVVFPFLIMKQRALHWYF